jgi:hypothetical protein
MVLTHGLLRVEAEVGFRGSADQRVLADGEKVPEPAVSSCNKLPGQKASAYSITSSARARRSAFSHAPEDHQRLVLCPLPRQTGFLRNNAPTLKVWT